MGVEDGRGLARIVEGYRNKHNGKKSNLNGPRFEFNTGRCGAVI